MLPPIMTKYLQTRAITAPWRIEGCADTGFAGAVVIPALAESGRLFATLRSLAAHPPELLSRFLVLVVVNHRQDAPECDKADNLATLVRLAAGDHALAGLRLGWVDAATPGRELPAKGGGVGLARKIGHDLALNRFDYRGNAPLLVSLDADTLVDASYLPAIINHFRAASTGGAVIPFRHQEGSTLVEQAAIVRYELFLRSYVLGLKLAGSPYAFHTVGSAMACTAAAYCRMGGMNGRTAGEDFYFLQQLHRTAGVRRIKGTVVRPAARPSHRVPFGTGRTIARCLEGTEQSIAFYRPACFRILGAWLDLVKRPVATEGEALLSQASAISPHLADYLATLDFPAVWERLRRTHRQPEALLRAFHGWFDGLKTMRLIHHLSAGPFPRCGPDEALPPLLAWAGLPQAAGPDGLLELLRHHQGHGAVPE